MDLPEYMQSLPRGGKKQLALRLRIPPSYLSRLVSGDRKVTAERAIQIELATGGLVSRFDVRPDVEWIPSGADRADHEPNDTRPASTETVG